MKSYLITLLNTLIVFQLSNTTYQSPNEKFFLSMYKLHATYMPFTVPVYYNNHAAVVGLVSHLWKSQQSTLTTR